MRRLRRFLALSAAERRLIVKAVLLLVLIKAGLKTLPFRIVCRGLDRASRVRVPVHDRLFPAQIAWAVTAAGHYLLGARPCLTQALAVRLLLIRRGHPAHLQLGVVRNDHGPVHAHAWVESGGSIVVGGPESEVSRFTRLLAADPGAK
jgi:hypothetical protein